MLAQLFALAVLLTLGAAPALGTEKGVATFFGGIGTEGGKFGQVAGIAVNQSGAGGVSPGDVYVVDRGNQRIQEFSASGEFVRAFGLDVGGAGVDVCTVAASCQAATASEAAGSLFAPRSMAIDQATGTVYVTGHAGGTGHLSNFRVDVFSATGEFEGAFGWNVKVTGGAEELQLCTAESGCKAGSPGFGAGQFSTVGDDNDSLAVSPLNGHVIVGDGGNRRIDEFAPIIEAGKVTGVSFVRGSGWGVLDGAMESQICTTVCHEPAHSRYCAEGNGSELGRFDRSQALAIAVDLSGKVYAINEFAEGEVGGCYAPPMVKRIETFSPTGNPEGVFADLAERQSHTYTMTRDASNGNILTATGSTVTEYGPSGEVLDTYLEGSSTGAFINGLAIDEQSETIYLSTQNPDYGVLILGEPVPPTASIEPVTAFTGMTATFKGHVNPKGFFAEYHFEYSADGVHWSALPTEELPADSEEHAVSAKATGMEAHTQYQVRLFAEKVFKGGTASAATSFETSAAAPLTSALSATEITDTAARLSATVNPENEATSYRFECVSQAQFEASGYAEAKEVPSGGATIEAGGEEVEVSQPLSGLSPATGYRCRAVASNPSGAAADLETSFTTYASQPLGLPDGRAYEQATPVDKNGADATGREGALRAAPEGSAATYLITGGGSAEGGGQHFGIYATMRGGGTWSGRSLWPSAIYGKSTSVLGWSQDLRRDYVVSWQPGQPGTIYEQNLESGAMSAIASGIANAESVSFAAESGDGARVLFESQEALTAEGVAGASNLYLWTRGSGKLSLVDLLPAGSLPFHGAFAGPYNWAFDNPKQGGGDARYYTQDLHVLSEDGSTAFFTSYNVAQLYARKGLGTAGAKTVQASASQKTNGAGAGGKDPHGPRKAVFMEATPDGHYVFFTSQEELTNDATTGTEDQGNDLYRYDTQSGQLIDIAPDGADANGADVQGVLGASADGSYVYFAANGVLAEGAKPGDCNSSPVHGWGHSGTCSIYLWHEGTIDLVAATGGGQGAVDGGLNWVPTTINGCCKIAMRTARVSANGTLLFISALSPTSYDSEGKQEFYRYEPGAGLGCVSCNPTGAPPGGDAQMQGIKAGLTQAVLSSFWVRNLSADGRRAFFETPDQLVASDLNGVTDVYEWEAEGTGSCESEAQDGGCLYLISTGESNEPSYFAATGESGEDVFFFTRQQLVGQDTDQLKDLYDAHVGGGIASQNEAPQPRCEGEACKGPAPPPPGADSAGSASFAGPGNPTPGRQRHKKKHRAKKRHGHHERRGQRRQAGQGARRQATKARAGR